jgi:outer membrane murein-binding lipoprotein Lpp
MCRVGVFAIFAAASMFALAGCESHQAKVDALQKQYDQLAAQFHQDCSAEYLKIPPTISAKCTDEDKKVKQAWDQLNAERSKQ